jgi:hypothetical protein
MENRRMAREREANFKRKRECSTFALAVEAGELLHDSMQFTLGPGDVRGGESEA